MTTGIVDYPDWRSHLVRGERNQVLAIIPNAALILQYAEGLRGTVAFNELSRQIVILKTPPQTLPEAAEADGQYPRPISNADRVAICALMQQREATGLTRRVVDDAIELVAAHNRYHPIRDYLRSLRWDGRCRIDHWLVNAFDAPATPYVRAIAARVLIAAVRRIRQPGCKFDSMLILEGHQGIGKSSAIQAVFGREWFTDRFPRDLDSDNAVRSMTGKWGIELPEIEQLIRADIETVKAFLSRQDDRLVPKYANDAVDIARQCVIFGTTNSTDYLRDPTGNRRFWPVPCASADPEWVALNRNQLWAEAAHREASGEAIYLQSDDLVAAATSEQAGRLQELVWQQPIEDWLAMRTECVTADVLSHALGIPRERHDRKCALEVAKAMRILGWTSIVRKRPVADVEAGSPPGTYRVWVRQ